MSPQDSSTTPSIATGSEADDLASTLDSMGRTARRAARSLATLDTDTKNRVLRAMAEGLRDDREAILEANARDLDAGRAAGLSSALLDRLLLDPSRIETIARAVEDVAELADPVGTAVRQWQRPNGLRIERRRTPIGVIGIIYESRPNVTCDAASLCFKAGNATILRGGSEARSSNLALARALVRAGTENGMPEGAVQLVPGTDREAVRLLCGMDDALDLLIPRGGRGLIETVVAHARMPVIKHYDGICHVYVDAAADLEMAHAISLDAKCQRPGVCNASETLLVHRDIAEEFLGLHAPALLERGVELRGDDRVAKLVDEAAPASEEDWATEYLDLVLSIRVVDDLSEAVDHIERYGSGHTDTIVTQDAAAAEAFLAQVDSSAVLWNASTRFNDGGELGFGAEIGISTDRLHARGPMGLEELTTYKHVVVGSGQTRG